MIYYSISTFPKYKTTYTDKSTDKKYLCVKSLNDKLLLYFIMSGTAGLSAAKNRRSGNEVKFNGQSKSLPPPEQTNTQANTQVNGRQQQQQPTMMMPNPMEILKSHEFRLKKLELNNPESSGVEQDLLNHKVDYLTLKTDFLTLKNDLLVKGKIDSHGKIESQGKVYKDEQQSKANKAEPNTDVLALQQRVTELNTIISNMAKELNAVKLYLREKVEPMVNRSLSTAASKLLPTAIPLPAVALASLETATVAPATVAPATVAPALETLQPLETITLPTFENVHENVLDNITISIN
jgi:hypothetical protein